MAFRRASLLVLLLLLACRHEADDATEAGPGTDALRALPYVAGSDPGGRGDGLVRRDARRSCPGYTLYAIYGLSRAELIDEKGNVVRTWSHSPSVTWENCELLPNGDLLVVGVARWAGPKDIPEEGIPDDARYLLRLDWEGNVRWKRQLRIHHDVAVTPDDRLVVLAFDRRLVTDVHPEVPVRDDRIILVSRDGQPAESQSFLDMLRRSPGEFPLVPVPPTEEAQGPWIDLFHANSLEWMHYPELAGRHRIFDPGNVLVCFRHQDRIAVFDWARSTVVWSWGAGVLCGPHDAHVLPNGHLLVFDNGLEAHASRGLEIDPETREIVWEYRADPPTSFFTVGRGSIQRLPNGNTLFAESDEGRAFEVTPSGRIVWEFLCPYRTPDGARPSIVRAKRFPREHIERITAMTPEARAAETSWFETMVR